MRRTWVNVFRGVRLACAAALAWAAAGCGGGRVVTVSTAPADALIRIDGADAGPAPVTQKLPFSGGETHTVLATRFGYSDQQRVLSEDPQTGNLTATWTDAGGRENRETVQGDLRVVLPPQRRRLTFVVSPPLPALLTLDGAPLSNVPVTQVSRWVEFTVDPGNHWQGHSVTAARPGFPDVTRRVEWSDPETVTLQLDPHRKDLHITSRPPGAEIFINGESRGAEPVDIRSFAFPVDAAGQFIPQKVTARKSGFDPVERSIGWDEGQTNYTIDLASRSKPVRVVTDPPGAVVKLDGSELPRDPSGASAATLDFAPADDKGTARVYSGTASKKDGDREWESAPFRVAWDNGRANYAVQLTEVKTRTVPLLRPRFAREDGVWRLAAETARTTAPRDRSEPAGVTVAPVLRPADGSGTIDTLATSPDGSQIVFSVLTAGPDGRLHGQLEILDVDGAPGSAPRPPRLLGDAKHLAITPSFSPDGRRVLFSSNRDGADREGAGRDGGDERRMSIWSIPADGSAPPTRLTSGDSSDLWPTLDSLPHARLFYQCLLDSHPEPRLFYARPGDAQAAGGTDLAQPGWQPHVSPAADAVLFDAPTAAGASGTLPPDALRRRLYTIPDTGGRAVELNHPADADDFDPSWSKDGSRIAFASNRPVAGRAGGAAAAGDYNIWVLDLSHPDSPTQLTFNAAWDDCPVWDASGRAVYFRSNRGGEWGIWKVSLK